MEKMTLLDINNAEIEVNVIRYFNLNNQAYLIYSLDEVDEQNYIKLYAVKITGNTSEAITDEKEWASIKDMVKEIIRGNKNGNLNVEDLDYNILLSPKVAESKVFKLSVQLADLLSANKKVFTAIEEEKEVEVEPVSEIEPSNDWNVAPEVAPLEEKEEEKEEEVDNTPLGESNDWGIPAATELPEFEETPTLEPSNYVEPTFEEKEEELPEVTLPVESEDNDETDYKAMYEEVMDKNEALEEELEELKRRIEAIKSML